MFSRHCFSDSDIIESQYRDSKFEFGHMESIFQLPLYLNNFYLTIILPTVLVF